MKYLSIFLLAIIALGAFATDIETHSNLDLAPGQSGNMKVTTTHTKVTQEQPRFRRWGGYYGSGYGNMGYGGYGRGYGGMGYGYGQGYGGMGGYYG